MATKKTPEMNEEKERASSLTIAVPPKKEEDSGPRVSVFLPRLEDDGSVAVDQYEHVTIGNENGEQHTRILRGERVEVTVPVYMGLKERYGKQI